MTKPLLKSLLFLSMLFAGFSAKAQVIFYEDFDGIPGPTAGGAGYYNFAPGFLLRNVDNRTPAGAVSYVNEAWERREDFVGNVVDSCAFSTSWYSPAGAADDWMWTPLIGPLPANAILSWNALAPDMDYQDGYEVRVMTAAQGPPTGGTGAIGNQLTNSTQVFSVANEVSTWTSHTVSLNAFAGQSVYIAFRNNSNDKFLLMIDDIKVEVIVNFDAQMLFADTATPYTQTPIRQVAGLNFNGTIRNNGVMSLNGVAAHVNVFDDAMTNVYSANSTATTVAAGATTPWTIPSYTPASIGLYTIQYIATQTSGTDQQPNNDTLYEYFMVTDSTYARDDGTVTGALGIGAGVVGYLGQDFQVNATTVMTSVSVYLTQGYTGRRFAAVVWDMPSGIPASIIGGTDTLLYPDDSARFYTIPANLILNPGRYAVTMIEFDSTIQIGLTNTLFTTNSTWVNWPGNPFGTWANNEDFGAGFAKSYVIRPNFACNTMVTTTSTIASCASCTDGTATATASGGTGNFSYLWAPGGQTTPVISGVTAGSYSVTVTDNLTGCATTATVVINACTVAANADSTQASCATCPDGTATANVTGGVGPFTYMWMPGGQTTQTATGLLPGTYTVTVTDSLGCTVSDITIVDFSTGINTIAGGPNVNVSPNPATDKLTFSIGLEASQEMTITLTNVLGETVYTNKYTGARYSNEINLNGYAKGVYFFEVKTENASKTVKVVVK